MNAARRPPDILLTFHPAERRFLHPILQSIHRHYAQDPFLFPDREQKVWYSTRGCESAGLGPEETRDWIRNLHQTRQGRTALLDSWIRILNPAADPDQPATLTLNPDQAPAFLAMINDHRLLLHARHDFGDEDLVHPLLSDAPALSPRQRAARAEIDLLAHIMEIVLRLIPGSGADWRENTDEGSGFDPV